jgi:aspartate/methionine/tyrosine aminotransferase
MTMGIIHGSQSLTADERAGLAAQINLADAHTYQDMTARERAEILERFVQIFEDAVGRNYWELEGAAAAAFGASLGQSARPNLVVATYASSISTIIVGRALRRLDADVSLTVPTFDNVHALLVGEGIAVEPRPLNRSLIEWVSGQQRRRTFVEVSPNNPTGHFISEQELRTVAAECAAQGHTLVLDQSFKAHDQRACFDYYTILEEAGARYILIEDTGKLWPVRDLKVSFIHCSDDLRTVLRDVADDVLLNVAPFILGLTETYARFSAREQYRNVRDAIAENRTLVRAFCATPGWGLSLPYLDSRVAVEVVAPSINRSVDVVAGLAARGLQVLNCAKFYWGGCAPQGTHLRIALARRRDTVEQGIRIFSEYLTTTVG